MRMPHKTQQEFIRHAMEVLCMTREQFATRLGCASRTLDKWLLPSTSNDFRSMSDLVWNHIREVLAHEDLKSKYTSLQRRQKKA